MTDHKLTILVVFPDAESVWAEAASQVRLALSQHDVSVCYEATQAGTHLPGAEVVLAFSLLDEDVRCANKLKWIQCLGAGVERLIGLPSLPDDVLITNMRGIHRAPVSEATLAMMLALSRNLPKAVRDQAQRTWQPWDSMLLAGKTVGIIGVGSIAETLAYKCVALGMNVVGISNRRSSAPHFARIHTRSELPEVIGEFDYVVLLAPLSDETQHIVNASLLAKMKRSAFLINVGRGPLVDHAALVDALDRKLIGGAALDALSPEPLPPESPLWRFDNVLITPHLAGRHDGYIDDALKIFLANIEAYRQGDLAAMINRVDRHSGLTI